MTAMMKCRQFQSTLPCGERQKVYRYCNDAINISIHAPLRGATQDIVRRIKINDDFNPRSPAGSDPSFSSVCICFGISIHAPLRGATFFWYRQF